MQSSYCYRNVQDFITTIYFWWDILTPFRPHEIAKSLVFGVVVTKNLFEQSGNILCIPAWMFLLIFSNHAAD